MSPTDIQPPNPFLKELVADLEASLAASGYSMLFEASARQSGIDSTRLVFRDPSGVMYVYEFEFREGGDHVEWIRDLQARAALSSAIYAVTTSAFTPSEESAAHKAKIGIHHVKSDGKNRIYVTRLPAEPGKLPIPLLLTQQSDEEKKVRWLAQAAAVTQEGNVTVEFSLSADANGKMSLLETETPHSTNASRIISYAISDMAPPLTKSQCYAAHLGGCDEQSGEHVISESVLNLFPGNMLDVELSLETPGALSYKKSKKALKWPILCKKHNSALSPIDDEGRRFFESLLPAWKADGSNNFKTVVIDGMSVERWMLKVACGIAAMPPDDGFVAPPAREWVDVLFGVRDWPTHISSFWSASNDINELCKVTSHLDAVSGRLKGIEMKMVNFSITLSLGSYKGVPGLERVEAIAAGNVNGSSVDIQLSWPPTYHV